MSSGKHPQHPRKSDIMLPSICEYTINLRPYYYGVTIKKRATRAVNGIREFAQKHMRTRDVRISVDVNKFVWSKGARSVPRRIRVRLSRRINENEKAKGEFYTLVNLAPGVLPGARHLKTTVIPDNE